MSSSWEYANKIEIQIEGDMTRFPIKYIGKTLTSVFDAYRQYMQKENSTYITLPQIDFSGTLSKNSVVCQKSGSSQIKFTLQGFSGSKPHVSHITVDQHLFELNPGEVSLEFDQIEVLRVLKFTLPPTGFEYWN